MATRKTLNIDTKIVGIDKLATLHESKKNVI
jgi:hypothetical protein